VFSVIAGITLVIVAVILWFGHVTLDHAVAILIGVVGVLVILGGIVPGRYLRL
jgi:hypothetical protein